MFEGAVVCPKCGASFGYQCEWEDAGDGSEHEEQCPRCKTDVVFVIAYSPHITNEVEVE